MRIGRYQVDDVWREEPLGRISRARLAEFDRAVLIRELVPPPHLSAEDRLRLVEAFREEGRVLGRIQHSLVQRAEELSEAGSPTEFLVFERPDPAALYPLPDVARTLSAESAVLVACEIARACAFLRAAGVPLAVFTEADVWLGRTGTVRLLPLSFASLSLRFGAAFAGGLPHLAPELLSGAAPTERSLVYSLAAWLYHRLAPAATPPEECAAVGRDPDPLWTLNPSVRAAVDETLQLALARDPSRRLATLEELSRRLQPVGAQPVGAPPVLTAAAPRVEPLRPEPEPAGLEVDETPEVLRWAGWAVGLAVAGSLTGYTLAHLFPPP